MAPSPAQLTYIEEPSLEFGYGQSSDDPKEGLFLYGPVSYEHNPREVRVGVIGSAYGIDLYHRWAASIQRPIRAAGDNLHHLFFPGFREVFGATWPEKPVAELFISTTDLSRALRVEDRHHAIFNAVSMFVAPIEAKLRDDDVNVDVWFVVVPEEVFLLGRPLSRVPTDERIRIDAKMSARLASRLKREPSLFIEDMEAAVPYEFDLDFHNQLKARLIDSRAVTQIVRESTLAYLDPTKVQTRRLQDAATVAWNLCTSSFFKAGGRPWKLTSPRPDTCYVGLVFKRNALEGDIGNACCGAQMFMDSGDGLVFKGAVGPWYSEISHDFHLPPEKANELMKLVLRGYESAHGGIPKEIVVHGRTRIDDGEWEGFRSVLPAQTNLVAVRIRSSDEIKLYREDNFAALRGLAYIERNRKGYLWTRGFIPKLGTYPGWEVPNPLSIEVSRGEIADEVVLNDVLQLTKLNFNACIYADGVPVTLRFADAIGEILTAAPVSAGVPLPFRHYI